MNVWVLIEEIEYDNGSYEPSTRVLHARGVFLRAEDANAEIARRIMAGSRAAYDSEAIVVRVEAQNYRLMRTALNTSPETLTEALTALQWQPGPIEWVPYNDDYPPF